ncbi:MAG: hypothetical protein AW07_01306 [Candidatus Accumulibacter sp. SK-11]|nr:MAG: hypothetical protein AW07_01306 [Candidatus Accumulibacter sp. SK-11]
MRVNAGLRSILTVTAPGDQDVPVTELDDAGFGLIGEGVAGDRRIRAGFQTHGVAARTEALEEDVVILAVAAAVGIPGDGKAAVG